MEKRSSNYPFARAADPIGDLTPSGTPKATPGPRNKDDDRIKIEAIAPHLNYVLKEN